MRGELIARVQGEALREFSQIRDDWLALMWSLDSFRVAGLTPYGMGRGGPGGFDGVYRGKGNWFATLLALLLENRTDQPIGARTNIQGFSQMHQIDIAWPKRKVDPRVCAESKVTGAPAFGSTPARRAMSDWSNRRKELKFAATDLKLARRRRGTAIEHWDAWRETAPPKTYFLWAARLEPGRGDRIDRMADEARALVDTYLDDVGIFAWQANVARDGYEGVRLPFSKRVTDLDDVLYKIASEIKRLTDPDGRPPEAEPVETPIEADRLMPDL